MDFLGESVDEDNWNLCMSALLDDDEAPPVRRESVRNSSSSVCGSSKGTSECGDDSEQGKKRKRVGTDEDAQKISEATEAMLTLLNLDPESTEGKKQRRRLRNRMSAAMHRERKKELIDTLADQLKERDAEIRGLRDHVASLLKENSALKCRLGAPSASCDELTSGSEYDSDSSASTGRKTFGAPVSAGVSLLSLVCLLTFSFQSVPELNIQFDEFPVGPSSSAQQEVSPVSRFLLASRDSVVDDLDNGDRDIHPEPQRVSPRISPMESVPHEFVYAPSETLQRPVMTSMYAYQDSLLQLYSSLDPGPIKVKLPVSPLNRVNLRSRNKAEAFSNQLVPVTAVPTLPSEHYSQVVLAQGRALLNPMLLSSHFYQSIPSAHEESPSAKALSTYSAKSSVPYSSVKIISALENAKDNLLVMLLPMSAVRWGSTWADGSNVLLESILRSANISSDSDADISLDSLWVEIGCSIFKAQLVRNVTMPL